jgi:hypothetical protein
MNFVIRKTKHKEIVKYKTLYIKDNLVKMIEKIAKDNDTSFNNVVISMIEKCLEISENT